MFVIRIESQIQIKCYLFCEIFRSNFFIGRKGFNATEFELDDLSKIKLFKKDVKKIGNDTLEILTRK